jgi:hypothetical protein
MFKKDLLESEMYKDYELELDYDVVQFDDMIYLNDEDIFDYEL